MKWRKQRPEISKNFHQREIFQKTTSGQNKNAIRTTYPPNRPYLAFPETKEGRVYLDTLARQWPGLGSCQMFGMVGLLLINFVINGRRGSKKEFEISDKRGFCATSDNIFKT